MKSFRSLAGHVRELDKSVGFGVLRIPGQAALPMVWDGGAWVSPEVPVWTAFDFAAGTGFISFGGGNTNRGSVSWRNREYVDAGLRAEHRVIGQISGGSNGTDAAYVQSGGVYYANINGALGASNLHYTPAGAGSNCSVNNTGAARLHKDSGWEHLVPQKFDFAFMYIQTAVTGSGTAATFGGSYYQRWRSA